MNQAVILDLEINRKRLEYYRSLKAQKATAFVPTPAKGKSAQPKTSPVDKWIEIYTERVQKLERQATRLGLKTRIKARGEQSQSLA